MPEYVIDNVQDQEKWDGVNVIKSYLVRYRIGNDGPFSMTVPHGTGWHDAARRDIEAHARNLKALRGTP